MIKNLKLYLLISLIFIFLCVVYAADFGSESNIPLQYPIEITSLKVGGSTVADGYRTINISFYDSTQSILCSNSSSQFVDDGYVHFLVSCNASMLNATYLTIKDGANAESSKQLIGNYPYSARSIQADESGLLVDSFSDSAEYTLTGTTTSTVKINKTFTPKSGNNILFGMNVTFDMNVSGGATGRTRVVVSDGKYYWYSDGNDVTDGDAIVEFDTTSATYATFSENFLLGTGWIADDSTTGSYGPIPVTDAMLGASSYEITVWIKTSNGAETVSINDTTITLYFMDNGRRVETSLFS